MPTASASRTVAFAGVDVEILERDGRFLGLGRIAIGGVAVRSGRLPLTVRSQSFRGLEISALRVEGVEQSGAGVTIRLACDFAPMDVKILRDHSFDPIHDVADWDADNVVVGAKLDLVLAPASEQLGPWRFAGFSYQWRYQGAVPLFHLLELASWELDGDIVGASVISQSSCSRPTATFAPDTAWTTEGVIHWDDEAAKANPVMTHNLPRWASHQAFDFQYKGARTLIGDYARVDLIRTILMREPGKAELKTIDKHIFDQATSYETSPKRILLNGDAKTATDQRNCWTWWFDHSADRARGEFGLEEEPLLPRLYWNYWRDFTIDTYYRDLIPAAHACGFRGLFIDQVNKSAQTEGSPHKDFHWNMCTAHEYEPSPALGGPAALKRLYEDCKAKNIRAYSWTNNDQGLSSPINKEERDPRGWFVHMEDTRTKYGGAYTNIFSILDFKNPDARAYWVDSLKKIKAETGFDAWLFDSFYNLGFMPVSFNRGAPSTQWRELLGAFKDLQDAGINFMIESFGPFGQPQHGCPTDYAKRENHFACYKVCGGFGYTTVPTGGEIVRTEPDVAVVFRWMAHMATPGFNLWQDGVRIDRQWTAALKQTLDLYYDNRESMVRRFLQEDDRAVLWHDRAGTRATLWNFVARDVELPGAVRDLTSGEALGVARRYRLEANHVYVIEAEELPTAVREAAAASAR
ncbi:MAG TPA: hypothetical protein VEL07_09955 [Planctomycetota bacterium]|nr:hypothetical protein [Planctomycetota bacterium]